jgi:catechol 2,3-dioxygenase-like lactoylglutathione lyase family enzyme
MKIYVTSVFVDDQQKAQEFYTEKLGFEKKHDIPVGDYRWLTLTEPGNPNSVELLLEPSDHPATKPFKDALVEDGIPFKSFKVADIQNEYERLLSLGVKFTQPPTEMGPVITAVLDDTCANLIQLVQSEE